MSEAVRSIAALVALGSRRSRQAAIWILFYGVGVPLLVFFWGRSRAVESGIPESRVLMGAVVFGSLILVVRRVGQTVVADRIQGVVAMLQANGVTRTRYLTAEFIGGMQLGMVPLLILPPALLGTDGLAPEGWKWILFLMLTNASAVALGLLVALLRSDSTVGLMTNACSSLLFALCPLLYPSERVPEAIHPFVTILPPSLGVEAMWRDWTGSTASVLTIPGLVGWVVLMLGVVAWRFPWQPR